MTETFENAKPWPADAMDRHHNQPPLEERIILDFDEALDRNGLALRLIDITANAEKAPEAIRNAVDAGKAADLIVMARVVRDQVDAERELLNRPLLTARTVLKARAEAAAAPMEAAIAGLRAKLDAFVDATGETAQGDYGGKVSARTDWNFEIQDYAKALKALRDNSAIMEAVEKAIRAQIRGGARDIPGVRIWASRKAQVR
jgi:hypothetical protein